MPLGHIRAFFEFVPANALTMNASVAATERLKLERLVRPRSALAAERSPKLDADNALSHIVHQDTSTW